MILLLLYEKIYGLLHDDDVKIVFATVDVLSIFQKWMKEKIEMGKMMDEGDEGLILLLTFFLFSGFWIKID